MNPKWLMINIDESSISRGTLKSRSWLSKGENWIIQNEVFRNSISIICSITSNGHYFVKPFTTSINSSDFMEYFKEMIRSVWNESKANYSHMLVILDNSSTHRSRLWLDLLKKEKWYTAFLRARTCGIILLSNQIKIYRAFRRKFNKFKIFEGN